MEAGVPRGVTPPSDTLCLGRSWDVGADLLEYHKMG